jgi:hypothetical protein
MFTSRHYIAQFTIYLISFGINLNFLNFSKMTTGVSEKKKINKIGNN